MRIDRSTHVRSMFTLNANRIAIAAALLACLLDSVGVAKHKSHGDAATSRSAAAPAFCGR